MRGLLVPRLSTLSLTFNNRPIKIPLPIISEFYVTEAIRITPENLYPEISAPKSMNQDRVLIKPRQCPEQNLSQKRLREQLSPRLIYTSDEIVASVVSPIEEIDRELEGGRARESDLGNRISKK